ncbi:hypothetical protein BKA61DRAFT_74860 [Leptodontidium sp. MPI-SDFR-AT-0119]|nr:hypothetical protein BKA61DRAFT_74860 [Leptodontidium sp. MPI-SDFR-AT-0119]
MPSGLTFINFSGGPQNGDPSNSKTVRSHVMKKYRQQRKAEMRNKPPLGKYKVPFYDSGIFSRPVEVQGRTSKLELPRVEATPSVEVSPRTASLPDSDVVDDIEEVKRPEMAAGYLKSLDMTSLSFLDVGLDAYNFLPIPASRRILMLLQANIKSTIRTSVHADPSKKYLSYYVDNAARLYIALSYSATRFQDQTGNGPSESLYYLMKSISAVNDDIADPQKQVSDSTIATVASMANIENLNGNPENSIIHLNGLKRMVEMRGGLDCLGMQGILQRVVLWADLCGASRTQTVPKFPLVRFPDMMPLPQFSPPNCTKSYLLVLNSTLSSRAKTPESAGVLDNLQHLHELSTFLNLVGKESDDLPVEACYPDRVYTVEHNILTSLYVSQSSPQGQRSNIWDILRHASLLFIYTNLRQTPVGGQIRKSLSNRLQLCMQDADLRVYKVDLPAEMLWVSCIGLVGTQDTSDYHWFLGCVERISVEHLIGSWEEVLSFCGAMPALERNCARKCESLWAKNIFS